MTSAKFAREQVTDDMIVAAITGQWQFTYQIIATVVGKQIKSVGPHYRGRLNRLVKAGRVEAERHKIPGQERWRLPT